MFCFQMWHLSWHDSDPKDNAEIFSVEIFKTVLSAL